MRDYLSALLRNETSDMTLFDIYMNWEEEPLIRELLKEQRMINTLKIQEDDGTIGLQQLREGSIFVFSLSKLLFILP